MRVGGYRKFGAHSWGELWGDTMLVIVMIVGVARNDLPVIAIAVCTKVILDALERNGIR